MAESKGRTRRSAPTHNTTHACCMVTSDFARSCGCCPLQRQSSQPSQLLLWSQQGSAVTEKRSLLGSVVVAITLRIYHKLGDSRRNYIHILRLMKMGCDFMKLLQRLYPQQQHRSSLVVLTRETALRRHLVRIMIIRKMWHLTCDIII